MGPVEKIKDLSVIIITCDEEADIGGCLESVTDIAGEIIVVDSGSKDQTLAICQKYTQKIYSEAWPGYSAQKQFALEKAQGKWILNIDADERVSPPLKEELVKLLSGQTNHLKSGYQIPFKHHFLGQMMRFGGALGETHIRLFQKSNSSYGQDPVHEGVRVQGNLSCLKNPIIHFSYKNLTEYLTKCNEYTTLIAEKKYESGARFHFYHHLRLPYEFFVRYFLKLGFLDGNKGLLYALLSSYYMWLKYMKLIDLEKDDF